MVIRWLADALADLRAIKAYIAKENPEAAQQVIFSICIQAALIADQPNMGRMGRIPDTRELVTSPYPYILAYREHHGEIHILAVVHTSRRWPEQLPKTSI
ncbi:MAG: type II toxin-antitoxin system RelE/ParE family toxin [Gallionella sp.]|nr:type II toxin-antitoxin system RelE/ParE family toxin [Gallionella sp.]